MSSTARGAERSALDFYETPAWCVQAIAPHLPTRPACVLDAGCGTGAIGVALPYDREAMLVIGEEIDPTRRDAASATNAYDRVHLSDFLLPSAGMLPEDTLIISNPPFVHSLEFVQRALVLSGDTGTVCMLLRLAFLETKKRRDFNRANPYDVYVLPKRPSFTDDGKTDSCAYMWAIWSPSSRDGGKVVIL